MDNNDKILLSMLRVVLEQAVSQNDFTHVQGILDALRDPKLIANKSLVNMAGYLKESSSSEKNSDKQPADDNTLDHVNFTMGSSLRELSNKDYTTLFLVALDQGSSEINHELIQAKAHYQSDLSKIMVDLTSDGEKKRAATSPSPSTPPGKIRLSSPHGDYFVSPENLESATGPTVAPKVEPAPAQAAAAPQRTKTRSSETKSKLLIAHDKYEDQLKSDLEFVHNHVDYAGLKGLELVSAALYLTVCEIKKTCRLPANLKDLFMRQFLRNQLTKRFDPRNKTLVLNLIAKLKAEEKIPDDFLYP